MVDKEARFKKVAELRVNKVLSALENLGKCSNKRSYIYTEKEAAMIFQAIDKKLKHIKALYSGTKSEEDRFSF